MHISSAPHGHLPAPAIPALFHNACVLLPALGVVDVAVRGPMAGGVT